MKYFTSMLALPTEAKDDRNLDIYQGVMCFIYTTGKYVGSYMQVASLCESKVRRAKLRGKPADSLRAANLNIQDMQNNQQRWFPGRANMRNLNLEYGVDAFSTDELVKALIEINFVTLDEACNHG